MIYLGADHRGFYLKESIREWLREKGVVTVDVGNTKYQKDDDYPNFAINLAENVVREKAKGILFCGSGVGMVVAANKVIGARAGLCTQEKTARLGRNDDDMNILCLSATLVSEDDNKKIIEAFLDTPFGSEEKYIRRINQIKKYESKD